MQIEPTWGVQPVLVLVGAHGAGKTTIGSLVADALGWRFDDEIGRRLRDEVLRTDVGAHAMVADERFDRRAMFEEAMRDIERAGVPRVVETWHPGNLAYALERSPKAAAEMVRLLVRRRMVGAKNVIVQPLAVSDVIARVRLSEPGPTPDEVSRFFQGIGRRCPDIARAFGWRVLPTVDTSIASPTDVAETVLEAVRASDWSAHASVAPCPR